MRIHLTRRKNIAYNRGERKYGLLFFFGGKKLKESKFQADLRKELKSRFPGCIITKNDAGYIQGIPDLLILWNDRWATLECKCSANATHQPNQDYYVEKMNDMSFSAFIFPENKEKVLDDLERSFKGHPKRCTCAIRS